MKNIEATKRCLKILRSYTCSCGAAKDERKVFCRRCFMVLPQKLRDNLYRGVDQGFEEAVAAAIKYLIKRGVVEK